MSFSDGMKSVRQHYGVQLPNALKKRSSVERFIEYIYKGQTTRESYPIRKKGSVMKSEIRKNRHIESAY